MRRSTIAGLAAACLLTCGTAMAEPCDDRNIVGVWSLSTIEAEEPGVEAFYATIADEWMRFGSDGGFIYVASRRPESDLTAINGRLDAVEAADGVRYGTRTDASGRLTISRDGMPFQVFQCDIADGDDGPVMAGNMILTSVPGAQAVRRVQSRISP